MSCPLTEKNGRVWGSVILLGGVEVWVTFGSYQVFVEPGQLLEYLVSCRKARNCRFRKFSRVYVRL